MEHLPVFFAAACGGLFLLSVLCEALRAFVRHDLEKRCGKDGRDALFTQIIAQDENVGKSLELGRGMLLFGVPILGGMLAAGNAGTLVGFFVLYMAAAYGLSRPLGKVLATSVVYWCWPICRLLSWFFSPLWLAYRLCEIVVLRLAGLPETVAEEDQLEEEIRSIVTEGHRDGFLENDARVMIERIMELDETSVSEIMTPRTEMYSLSKGASWEEMLTFVNDTQLSRIPIFEKNRDDIIGVLYAKDLLEVTDKNWLATLRSPVFVPETKQVPILLREFLQTHNHFAIVLDEYGGVTGIVTLEDILEEIVGEITDETDKTPQEEIVLEADGSAVVLGQTHIDEVNQRLEVEFPEEDDYETVGGMLLTVLGHVPVAGEEAEVNGVRIVVLDATPRKVERVRVIK
ncbi:MAG: hemolysin family protein [Planctomycetia bacterium]|nr:hemolysin family protein [Planctomycetia bacterium]